MTSRRNATFLKVLGVCVCAALGFVVLNQPIRAIETQVATALLNALGMGDVRVAGPTTVLMIPDRHAAFHVLITPSCSSIASLLAFGCLTPLVPSRTAIGRLLAAATAALLIVAGNLVRITASMAIGLVAGRGSLVLFHDWVGTMFTVIYTLTGYVLMLSFLLPRTDESSWSAPSRVFADAH